AQIGFDSQIAKQQRLPVGDDPVRQAAWSRLVVAVFERALALVDQQRGDDLVEIAAILEAKERVHVEERRQALIHLHEHALDVQRRVDHLSDRIDHVQLGQALFAFAEQARFFQSDSQLVGQCGEKPDIALAESIGQMALHRQHADHLILASQWNAHPGANDHFNQRYRRRRQSIALLSQVLDIQHLAMVDDPTGESRLGLRRLEKGWPDLPALFEQLVANQIGLLIVREDEEERRRAQVRRDLRIDSFQQVVEVEG